MALMLVVGSRSQEAAAIRLMVDRRWPGAGIVALVRTPCCSLPAQDIDAQACDSCLVDLAGVGMLLHSADHQLRLLEYLSGRSAVLLLPSGNTGWSQCVLPAAPGQTLIRLPSTCSAAELGEALYQLRAAMARDRHGGRRDAPAGVTSTAPRPPREAVAPVPTVRTTTGLLLQGATVAVRVPRHARLQAGAPVVFDAFPDIARSPLLATFGKAVTCGGCIKITLPGRDVSPAVIHTQEGWIASRMTAFALRTSAMDPEIIAASRVDPFSPDRVGEVLAQEFGDRRYAFHPLDRLAWDLLHEEIGRLDPERHQDISMRIVRFPNFNLIRSVGINDMQMAALCLRVPEPISGLERRFARNRRAVRRFAITAILSGHATASAVRGATGEPHLSSHTRPGSNEGKARRGFFQSLLDRIF